MSGCDRRDELVVAAASLSVGCFPSTFNVRADKAFANEPPVAAVVRDRAADIEKLRASWVELLTKTPYAPGDAWIESIGMAGEVAERARGRDAGARAGRLVVDDATGLEARGEVLAADGEEDAGIDRRAHAWLLGSRRAGRVRGSARVDGGGRRNSSVRAAERLRFAPWTPTRFFDEMQAPRLEAYELTG